jgi:PAS domain S-box-containing protein
MVHNSPAVILVVEDDPGIALLQRRRLERSGFGVEVATGVESAMDILSRGAVDLVLMDYRLGATTGLDLHGQMKASGFDLPVVIVSGSMDDHMVIDAIRAGVRDVILKSTDYLEYLPDAVRGVLKQAASAAERRHERSAARVLIVEDDAGTAMLERRQIERAGYPVAIATTADEALAVLDSGPVSLAVIDLRLPGGQSGIGLYERMKQGGWHIPAILVTAFPDQAVAIEALRAGIRDFVPKSADFLDYLPTTVDRIITQARVERKLIESELRLASIIGAAMDAILMCDEQRRIVLFNRSAEELFQCAAADAMGAPLDRFIPDLQLAAAHSPAGALRQRLEVDAARAGGAHVPIEVSVSEVVVHDRRLFTVIARDVSERRRIEAELREADRRKDEFLGMLAHELRNPLAAITGAGEVLHQAFAEPRAQKLINVVRRQSRALARMVDDLLDVSRVTLGKIRLSVEPLVLNQVATRVADNVRDEVARAGLEFEVRVDAESIWLLGDATRLEQVLTNLLTNAVKFTPPGGRIMLDVGREGESALVRVRDTGIGMDPALVTRVFDLFVQGDTSLARSKSGLGIGLALVRQVVALHGGEVWARSEGPGTGSEFVVRLPVAPEESLLPPEAASAPVGVDQRMRVLVVDDQPDVADAVALLIETLGHDAQAAYDGRAALEASRSNPPDVMLVDVGMPGMTGYELAGHVRLDRQLAGVRLVALTGYGREEDRARAMEAGFDLHLTKPVMDTTLQQVLATLRGNTAI